MRCRFDGIIGKENNTPVTLKAPPSKSVGHRLLICAALADGMSKISGLELSEDILATVDCLKALGAEIELEKLGHVGSDMYEAAVKGIFTKADPVSSDALFITNRSRHGYKAPILDCRECGSTLRFMIPVCTLMYSRNMIPGNQSIKLTGSARLLSRPLEVYDDLFKYSQVTFAHNKDYVEIRGSMMSGNNKINGNISSQFVTGLLFTLPMLDGDSRLEITPPIESRPYIDITTAVLNMCGVDTEWENDTTIYMKGGQHYDPMDVTVEGDWSNGAILLVLSRLYKSIGRDIRITGLDSHSMQGDKAITGMLDAIDRGETVDITDYPDLGPVLMAYMAATGGGHMTGTSRLAIKESDRGAAMKEELAKMGVVTEVGNNDIRVNSPEEGLHRPDKPLDGHGDHRIVMSMSVLCSIYGGTIDGIEAVNKSFPSFFKTLEKAMGEENAS